MEVYLEIITGASGQVPLLSCQTLFCLNCLERGSDGAPGPECVRRSTVLALAFLNKWNDASNHLSLELLS